MAPGRRKKEEGRRKKEEGRSFNPHNQKPFFHRSVWESMRREGRQHGMVMTFMIPADPSGDAKNPQSKKIPKRIEGPFMGAFAKAPSRPTNASRYTGRCKNPRCGLCHDKPASKARAKAKRTHKHRDEGSDFFFKSDCEFNYVSDDGGEFEVGERAIVAESNKVVGGAAAGDREDGEWVLVEGF